MEGASDVEGGDVEMADGADGGVGAEGGGDSNDVGIEIDTLPPQSQSFDLSPADSLIAPALLYSKAHMSMLSYYEINIFTRPPCTIFSVHLFSSKKIRHFITLSSSRR